MRSDYLNSSSGVSNLDKKIRKVTASVTLDGNDSGSIILVNPTAATTITLPSTLVSGWNCRVVCTEDIAATDGSMDQIVNVDMGSGTNLANIGQVHEVDGTAGNFAAAGDDFFVFTAASTPGDQAEFWTDGERWYIQAYVKDLSDSDFSANATTIA